VAHIENVCNFPAVQIAVYVVNAPISLEHMSLILSKICAKLIIELLHISI